MADYQLEFEEIDLDDWCEWALAHNAEVLAFIQLRPRVLYLPPQEADND